MTTVTLPCRLPAHAERRSDHLPGSARLSGSDDQIGDLGVLCGPSLEGESEGVEPGFVGSLHASSVPDVSRVPDKVRTALIDGDGCA